MMPKPDKPASLLAAPYQVEDSHACWSDTGFPGHDKEAKVNLGSPSSEFSTFFFGGRCMLFECYLILF